MSINLRTYMVYMDTHVYLYIHIYKYLYMSIMKNGLKYRMIHKSHICHDITVFDFSG